MRWKFLLRAFYVGQYLLFVALFIACALFEEEFSSSFEILIAEQVILLCLLFFQVWFYRLFERVIRHEEEKLYVRFQEEKIEERRQRVLFASDPYTKQVAFYRHDMRNQLQTIQALQELGKDQEALHYLDQLIEQGRAMEAKHES